MEFRQLVTFRKLAQTLSFSKAARVLNYAQSSVSAQIKALEDELDVLLFDRLGKQVTLTVAGKVLLGYAERLLSLAEEARAVVTDAAEPSGTLTVCAPETLCAYRLPAIIERFRSGFPKVQLVFKPSNFVEQRQLIAEGSMDIALIINQPLTVPDLVIESLVEESLVFIAHPNHSFASRPKVLLAELESQSMLLTEKGCGYRNLLEHALISAGLNFHNVLEFHSIEAIKQCAIAGLGIGFLPEIAVAAELRASSLVRIAVVDLALSVHTQMLWHKDKWLSPAIRGFQDTARAVIGAPAAANRVQSRTA